MMKSKTLKKKRKPKTVITFSSLDMTGVQKVVFTELKPDKVIYFNGKKHWIMFKKVGSAKGKYSKK